MLNGLGESTLAAGRPAGAAAHHTAALTIAVELGIRDQEARAQAGPGRALNDPFHLSRALELYTELGLPAADQIRKLLATVGASLVPSRPPRGGRTGRPGAHRAPVPYPRRSDLNGAPAMTGVHGRAGGGAAG